MPLIQGFSDEAISRNIQTLIKEGKSPKQAKAIAEAVARTAKRQQMADGGVPQEPLRANLLGLAMQKAGVQTFAGGGGAQPPLDPNNPQGGMPPPSQGRGDGSPGGDTYYAVKDAEKWWNDNQINLFGGSVQPFQAYGPGNAPGGDSAGVVSSQNQMQGAQGQGQEIYNQQNALASQLRDTASGKGPSLAAMQNRTATDRNIANAQSMAASARGVNPALAARMAGEQAAGMNQQAAGQSAMARLAEQKAAQEQLGALYGQQAQAANQRMGIWGQQYGQNLAAQMGAQEINAKTNSEERAADNGIVGGILGGIGQVLAEGGEVEDEETLEEKKAKYLAGLETLSAAPPPAADSPLAPQRDTSLRGVERLREPTFEPERGEAIAPQRGDMGLRELPELQQPRTALSVRQAFPIEPIAGSEVLAEPDEEPRQDASLRALSDMREPSFDTDLAMAGQPQSVNGTGYSKPYTKPEDEEKESGKKSKFDTGKLLGGLLSALLGVGYLAARRGNARPIKPFYGGGYSDDENDEPEINSKAFTGEEEKDEEEESGILSKLFADGGPGGHVPGMAPIPGPVDTTTNDVVPAYLSPGEIVLPRSVTKSPHPEERAAGFVLGVKSTRAHPLPTNPTPEDMARMQERMLNPQGHADGGPIDQMMQLPPKVQQTFEEWRKANDELGKTYQQAREAKDAEMAGYAQSDDGSGYRQMKADLIADERHAQMQQNKKLRDALFASTMAAALRDANAAKAKGEPVKAATAQKAVDDLKVPLTQEQIESQRGRARMDKEMFMASGVDGEPDPMWFEYPTASGKASAFLDGLVNDDTGIKHTGIAIEKSRRQDKREQLTARATGGEIQSDIDKYLGDLDSLNTGMEKEEDEEEDGLMSTRYETAPDDEDELKSTNPYRNGKVQAASDKYLAGLDTLAEGGEPDLMKALPARRPSLRKALMFPGGGPVPDNFEKVSGDLDAQDYNNINGRMARSITEEARRLEMDDENARALTRSEAAFSGDPVLAPMMGVEYAGDWADRMDRRTPAQRQQEGMDFLDAQMPVPTAEEMVAWEEGKRSKSLRERIMDPKAREAIDKRNEGQAARNLEAKKQGPVGIEKLMTLEAINEARRRNGEPLLTGREQAATGPTSEQIARSNDAISQAVNTPGIPPPPTPAQTPIALTPRAPVAPGATGRPGGSQSVAMSAKTKSTTVPQGPTLEAPLEEQSPEHALHDANKDLVAAIQANADVAGRTALMQAAALEKGEAERRIRAQEFDATQKLRQQQLADLADDIRNSKVDPANLWNSKSTGEKIMASIGIMFGAMAQGLQGLKTNPVLDMVNQQIDRDIEAQKANLHKKQGLYRNYLDLTGNEIAAEQYARSDLLASTAAQMQLTGLKMGSEQARVGASYAIAELQKAQQASDVAAANALVEQRIKILNAASEARLREAQAAHMAAQTQQGWASIAVKSRAADAKAKKDAADATIDVFVQEKTPSGKSVVTVQPKVARDNVALRKVAKIQGDTDRFVGMVDEFIALSERNPHGGTPFSDDVARMKALQPELQFELSNAQKQGVVRREEAAKYAQMIPDATDFRLGVRPEYAVGLRALRDNLKVGAAREIKPLLSKSGSPSSVATKSESEEEE